jgi:hypothetical protein
MYNNPDAFHPLASLALFYHLVLYSMLEIVN